MSQRRYGTTKADLIDSVYQRHGGLTKNEAADVVDSIFTAMKSTLSEGRSVRIKNFDIFEVTERAGRRGVNPMSGEEIFIEPHNGLSFRPARLLKKLVEPLDGEKVDE